MTMLAGQKATADNYNADVVDWIEDILAADETITTSLTDVTGVTQTFSTPVANTEVKITATCDMGSTGGTDFGIITCVVDGVTQTGNCKLNGAIRAGFAQQWVVTIAAAGSHTIKLQKQKVNNSNTVTLYGSHTKMVIEGNGI